MNDQAMSEYPSCVVPDILRGAEIPAGKICQSPRSLQKIKKGSRTCSAEDVAACPCEFHERSCVVDQIFMDRDPEHCLFGVENFIFGKDRPGLFVKTPVQKAARHFTADSGRGIAP